MFFLLFAAFTMYLGWPSGDADRNNLTWVAAAAIGILLVSVLLHELGHYFTAKHFGGDATLLVLWPLGGLCPLQPPADPRRELAMHLAGPLVNLSVCVVAGIVLASRAGSQWVGLLHPLSPTLMEGEGSLQAIRLIFWINWVIFVANLLPAFPFDGGRALRAAILTINPEANLRRTAFVVAGLAKLASVVLIVLAILCWSDQSNRNVPIWFSLALLAIFLYFSAKQEEERAEDGESEEEMIGYDFSQGYTSLERTSQMTKAHVSPFRRWLEDRRQARLQQQRELEADEERRVDEILARLHEQGMSSISAEDQALLKRVSQRLKHRQAE
jgi:Zn-dependent protease